MYGGMGSRTVFNYFKFNVVTRGLEILRSYESNKLAVTKNKEYIQILIKHANERERLWLLALYLLIENIELAEDVQDNMINFLLGEV